MNNPYVSVFDYQLNITILGAIHKCRHQLRGRGCAKDDGRRGLAEDDVIVYHAD